MEITRLGAGDEERYRDMRLRALADAPKSFASTLEREQALTPAAWTARLTDERTATLLAGSDGTPGGITSVRLEEAPGTAQLLGMWVAPEARGHGLGRRLIEAAVEWARGHDVRRLGLWVTEINGPARALYERTGFRPTGERQPLPSDTSLMEIKLVRQLRG